MIIYKYILIFQILAALASNANGTNVEDLRKSIGVKQLWEVPLKHKPEVTVIIHDEFPKSLKITAGDKDHALTHGERVTYVAKTMNPRATFIELYNADKIPQDLFSARTIVNMSYRSLLNTGGFEPYIIKAAQEGAIVVKAAGNDAEIYGLSVHSKMLAEEAAKINQDPEAKGAIIIVGAGDPIIEGSPQYNSRYGFISEYSAIAGEAKDSYVFVNTSLLTIKIKELADGQAEYKKVNGTSFAAPTVSGILSLLWMHFPNATGKEIANMVFNSARLPREIPASIYIWLSQRTNKKISFWKNILSPEDVYGRGSVGAMRAFERGKANNNPQPKKLNTQDLRAQLQDVTMDYRVLYERKIFRKFMDGEMIDKGDLDLLREAKVTDKGVIDSLHKARVGLDGFLERVFHSIRPGQSKKQLFEEQPYFALHYAFYILNKDKKMAELAARSASKYFKTNKNKKDELKEQLTKSINDRWPDLRKHDEADVKAILGIFPLTPEEIEKMYKYFSEDF